jgi:glucuronokinase
MSDLRPQTVERLPDGRLRSRVCARASLLGNPSDGYGGAVLSLSLAQFAAEVILTPGDSLRFQPNPIGDRLDFEDVETFVSYVGGHGYRGGIPVLQAVVRQVCQNFCIGTKSASPLPLFSLSYSTNIPRQRGLSGSSAIACAALNCVLDYWGLSTVCPPTHRPALLLAAEQDLGIQAGLQDRIVQVFGGIVFADYSDLTADQSQSQTCRKGARVTRVHNDKTHHYPPLLFIVYPERALPGKDSGQVHSNFKRRWDSGNMPELRAYMEEMAQLARNGVKAFEDEDWEKLGHLMDKTFALRRLMFGDNGLGLENIKMVEQLKLKLDNIHATLCGSGGALAVLCSKHDVEQATRLKSVCSELALSCHQAQVGPSLHEDLLCYAKGDFDPAHRAKEFLFVPFCLSSLGL